MKDNGPVTVPNAVFPKAVGTVPTSSYLSRKAVASEKLPCVRSVPGIVVSLNLIRAFYWFQHDSGAASLGITDPAKG